MTEGFETLTLLQELDLQIVSIEKSREEFPEQLAGLEASLAGATNSISALQDKLAKAIKNRNDVRDQIEDAKAALDKSQERLSAVKTNKEYDAVHQEMENHKHTLAGGEKRMEKLAEDISKIESQVAELEDAAKSTVDELTPRISELREKIAAIDSNLSTASEKRAAAAALVPKTLLRAYENVHRGKKGGRVIAFVNSTDRTCQSCYQKLQPHVVNVLRRGGGINHCQNCGAIMIWQE